MNIQMQLSLKNALLKRHNTDIDMAILLCCTRQSTLISVFFCYNWHELCSSMKFNFSIICCFLVKYAIKYQTWMSSYSTPCYADLQRAMPSDSGAGTSSYWVMPSYTAISNFSIFWGRAQAGLIYFPISVAMFSMMFHRLMWTNFVYYILDIRLYLSLSVNLTSHFSNFADLRQL